MVNLKPCPFCGGNGRIVYGAKRKDVYGKDITGVVVYCDNCNTQMFYRDSKMAIEAWNRREPNGSLIPTGKPVGLSNNPE